MQELKFYNVGQSIGLIHNTSEGFFVCLNDMNEDTGVNQRIGSVVYLHKLHVGYQSLQVSPINKRGLTRFDIIIDWEPTKPLSAGQYLEYGSCSSPRHPNYMSRFTTLYSWRNYIYSYSSAACPEIHEVELDLGDVYCKYSGIMNPQGVMEATPLLYFFYITNLEGGASMDNAVVFSQLEFYN